MARHAPALLAIAMAASPASAGQPSPPIVGGDPASTCDWPSVVLLDNGSLICTGTLVHPRVVLYAAHCGVDFTQIVLGEGPSSGRFARVSGCRRATEIDDVSPMDYAYCELERPLLGVPIAPILYGCEGDILATPPHEVVIAGFGEDENHQVGFKRSATTTFSGIAGGLIVVGGNGIGASFGDSGGPAFVRLGDGSWRAFGIVTGGPGAGMPVYYVDMRTVAGWVEEESGIDITPCHAVDGSWEASYECGGFATDPTAGGSWDDQCSGEDPLSGRSETCGPPQAADEELPRVSIAAPEDGAVYDAVPSNITVEVEASDQPSGVRRVWLEVDGQIIQEDLEEPWSFTASFEKGSYTVAAFAEDAGGNVAGSSEVDLYVGEEPGGCLGCRAGGGGQGMLGSILLAALAWRRLSRRAVTRRSG